MDDSLYLSLNISEIGMLTAYVFPSSSFISAIISCLGTYGTLLSLHINATVSYTSSSRR
jgi:hypothetical protein